MIESYHNQIIQTFKDNLGYFEPVLGFPIKQTQSGIYFHPFGEIDLIVDGFTNERCLIEVKSNNGATGKFLHKQFKVYRKFDPNASIYLLLGTTNCSLNLEELTLIRHHAGVWCA